MLSTSRFLKTFFSPIQKNFVFKVTNARKIVQSRHLPIHTNLLIPVKLNLLLLMALKTWLCRNWFCFWWDCLGGRMSRILDGMVTESGILSAFCNICQRFKSETGSLSGTVEVTYVSLKSVYSIQDRWDCPKSYIHTLSSSSQSSSL